MGSKIYRNENLVYTGDGNEVIVFRVQMVSNGNEGRTHIKIPATGDQFIENTGQASLGLLKRLIQTKTAVYCTVKNPTTLSDTISVDFYVNDVRIHRHENLKSETENPFIILKIKFSMP